MGISGALYKRTTEALLSAFASPESLKDALSKEYFTPVEISSSSANLHTRAYELVGWADSEGRLVEVIQRLRRQNPGNPKLAAIEQELVGNQSQPTTAVRKEIVVNNEAQRIDSKHHDGIIPLIAQALVCTTPQAEAFLNELIESDTTYAKLAQLDRDTITDAARASVPGVKAVRINDVASLLKLLTSTVKVSKSGHLNITYSTLSGRWEILSNDTCTKDGSLFEPVKFPQPVIGWNDGKTYAAGTLHDDDGNPMTERGVNDYLMNVRGSELHPWIRDASRDYPTLTIIDLMRHLRQSGQCRSSVEVYNFLISPQTTLASTQAQVAKIVRDAFQAPTPNPQPQVAQNDRPVSEKLIRDTLARLYPDTAQARVLASDAGLRTGSIDFGGAINSVWYSIFDEARKSQKVKHLLTRALLDYPNDPTLQRIAREY